LALRGCYVLAVARCAPPANKLLPAEVESCREYLAREWSLLPEVRAVLALGKGAMDGVLAMLRRIGRVPAPQGHPFRHRVVHHLGDGLRLLGSYHPSQQNTFTGKLTAKQFDAVVRAVNRHLGRPAPRTAPRVGTSSTVEIKGTLR